MRRFKMRLSLWAALGLVVTFGAVSHGVSASESNCNDNDGDSATAHLGALISTNSNSCVLVFSAQPGNALLSTNITSNGFNSSGAPVAVEVENDNGWPVAGVTVTLSLLPAGSSATLSGPLSSVSDSNGIATFGRSESPLAINQTGYYQLQAGAAASPSAASSGFQITDTAQLCSSNPCATSTTGTSTSASATAVNEQSGDVLSLGLGGFSYSCDNSAQDFYKSVSQPAGTDVWESSGNTIDTSANGQVTIDISKATGQQSPNRGAAHFQICYASTATFTPLAGTSILTATAPGGITLYYGLLPVCGHEESHTGTAPCLLSRHKGNAGDVILTYDGTGDFWGQG